VTDGKPVRPPLPRAFPADGYSARWSTWDGRHDETLSLEWQNEAWTATGSVGRENVQYVIRLSPLWQVRQFLLFRDLPDPDLWLGTDGGGRWGEVNGAHRTELDGAFDVALRCTPFTHTLPIRRHPLLVGDSTDLSVIEIDVQTLGVVPVGHRYERLDERRWRVTRSRSADGPAPDTFEFDVDEFGVANDLVGQFRRID
jgi:hypothetical protein